MCVTKRACYISAHWITAKNVHPEVASGDVGKESWQANQDFARQWDFHILFSLTNIFLLHRFGFRLLKMISRDPPDGVENTTYFTY